MDASLSLTDEVRAELDAAVAEGGYPGPAELIRDLLDDYRRRRAALADALDEGERSGFSEYSFDDIIAEAKARYQAG